MSDEFIYCPECGANEFHISKIINKIKQKSKYKCLSCKHIFTYEEARKEFTEYADI